MDTYIALCLSALAGGAINAVAGGGTLLTFPALYVALGSTPAAAVLANGTSTVALFPGSISALWGYRRELEHSRHWLALLLVPSLLGGALGTVLVVALPAESFEKLVPWLILTAALLFTLQPRIARWTGIGQEHRPAGRGTRIGAAVFQFLVALYGGYFGAGIGILMLTALALVGLADIHQMNAIKTLLASLINGIAVVVFIVTRNVHWPYAAAMAVAATVGGYVGARTARRLNPRLVRWIVVIIGYSLAIYYFVDQYGEFFRSARQQ